MQVKVHDNTYTILMKRKQLGQPAPRTPLHLLFLPATCLTNPHKLVANQDLNAYGMARGDREGPAREKIDVRHARG